MGDPAGIGLELVAKLMADACEEGGRRREEGGREDREGLDATHRQERIERPGDGADRRRPDHRAEVAPATTGVGEVGRGEPRLQIAGVARTDQDDPDDQQGEQPQRRGRPVTVPNS